MIGIEIHAQSLFEIPFLKVRLKNTFIANEKYKLRAKMKNMDTTSFPGGQLLVKIQWPNLTVKWQIPIKALKPGEVATAEFPGATHVLDERPALFLASGIDAKDRKLELYRFSGDKYSESIAGFHIYTILPRKTDELYQLWALMIAAFSLVILVIKEVLIPILPSM